MIGRRCKHSNVFSRPVLIARNLSGKPDFKPRDLSQEIYCGGYISVDPPLPIPNREVKHTGADGSAIPSVRVGSCRFSRPSRRQDPRVSLFFIGAKPPQSPCALKVLYDFAGTISLTPVDSILSMKRAGSVDKTARNAIHGCAGPASPFPANHLARQSPFYVPAGHIGSRDGIDLCPSSAANPSRQRSRAYRLARCFAGSSPN